jgi:hypothetical protein
MSDSLQSAQPHSKQLFFFRSKKRAQESLSQRYFSCCCIKHCPPTACDRQKLRSRFPSHNGSNVRPTISSVDHPISGTLWEDLAPINPVFLLILLSDERMLAACSLGSREALTRCRLQSLNDIIIRKNGWKSYHVSLKMLNHNTSWRKLQLHPRWRGMCGSVCLGIPFVGTRNSFQSRLRKPSPSKNALHQYPYRFVPTKPRFFLFWTLNLALASLDAGREGFTSMGLVPSNGWSIQSNTKKQVSFQGGLCHHDWMEWINCWRSPVRILLKSQYLAVKTAILILTVRPNLGD